MLGSILLILGGPGTSGRDDMTFVGQLLQEISGGRHDIITFDPRGTGNTIPFSCYESNMNTTRVQQQQQQQQLVDSILNRETGNASNTALATNWAMGKIMADACYQRQGEAGTLIGTDFVARDVMRIVDALGGDGLLRYWGEYLPTST